MGTQPNIKFQMNYMQKGYLSTFAKVWCAINLPYKVFRM